MAARFISLMLCCLLIGAGDKAEKSSLEQAQRDSQRETKPTQAKEQPAKSATIIEAAQSEKKQSATDKASKEVGEDPIVAYTRWLVYFTAVLAISTSLLFWYTRKAALAALLNAQSAEDLSRINRMAARAWVSVKQFHTARRTNFTVDNVGSRKNGFAFQIEWANAGKTPAFKCYNYSASAVVAADAGIPHFDDTFILDTGITIISGTSGKGHELFIEDATIDEVIAGRRKLFLYNFIDYEDVFYPGTKRRTEVCIEVTYAGIQDGKKIFDTGSIGPQNSSS